MSLPLPPLYALRAFDIAALHGSYTRAAEALHVTPGAISRHIRTLEAHFHCQLFLRKGPRVELTDAGRALASQLRAGFVALESACDAFRTARHCLRLKAPTTLTVNWLLQALKGFHERHSLPEVQVSSVWMDVDRIDFHREAFDCAILLGNGQFGEQTHALRLFAERLAPVCAPSLVAQVQRNLPGCDLIHPSADRRDWRRWLKDTPLEQQVDISRGHLFDTLEQGLRYAGAGEPGRHRRVWRVGGRLDLESPRAGEGDAGAAVYPPGGDGRWLLSGVACRQSATERDRDAASLSSDLRTGVLR